MDADAARFDRDDCAPRKIVAVAHKRLDRCGSLYFSTQRHETHNAAVRLSTNDRDLTEILVECDENLTVAVSMREYFLVAPEEGAAAMRDWYAWFCRTESPTVQEQEQAAALVSLVLRG